ncbi:MAG: Rv3654c family TadE-like protein [Actinomycetota bacterium]
MSDRGSATIVAVALVSLLTLTAVGLTAVGRAAGAHAQAAAAADGAALAAAPLTFLPGSPREEAADYARRNGARLVRCRCGIDTTFRVRVVEVEVAKVVDLPVFGEVTVRGRAAAEFDPMDLLGA